MSFDSSIVNELREFLYQVNNLLDKIELLKQMPDIEDLWVLIQSIEREILELKGSEEDLENNVDMNNITKHMEEISKKVTTLRTFIGKYSRPEDLLHDISRDMQILKNLIESLIKLNKQLKSLSFAIADARDSLLESMKILAFGGRESKKKERELKEAANILSQFQEKINNCREQCSRLTNQLIEFAKERFELSRILGYDRMGLHVAKQLSVKIQHGLWAKGVLDTLTGLQSVTASPISEFIEFTLEDIEDEDLKTLGIDELFFRYPPFEPIAIKKKVPIYIGRRKIEVELSGSHVWFVDSQDLSDKSRKNLFYLKLDPSSSSPIINGISEDRGSSIELRSVEPVNIVNRGEILLRVISESGRAWIKYGSKNSGILYMHVQKSLDRVNR